MKKVLVSFVVSLAVVCGTAISSMADAGPADIVLEGDKKSAIFPHKKHQDAFSCGECHHSMADGKQVAYVEGQEIKKCGDCHNPEVLGGKMLGKLKLDTLKGAGHGNCLACHKEKAKADAALKEIAKCGACHPKK